MRQFPVQRYLSFQGGAAALSYHRLTRGRRALVWTGIVVFLLASVLFTARVYASAIDWRLKLIERKLEGGLPDLHWSELFTMTAGRDRFSVGVAVVEGRSLEAVITNPYDTPSDLVVGEQVFRDNCAACHGNDASGGHGPSLLRESYTYGDSEFAIYKTLRDGVANTAMAPRSLTWLQRWQVIAYIRSLQESAAGGNAIAHEVPIINVTAADLAAGGTKPDEWLTYSGSLKGWRYSLLEEITRKNVGRLRQLWIHQFPAPATVHESTPLVIGNTIFVTESPSNAVALDARTGVEIWRYNHPISRDLALCCGAVNRGLAVLGDTLFLAALDGHLIGLDARTGRIKWQRQVADAGEGYTMNVAPLAFGNTVVTGVAGGEYGIRGFIAAYAADSGKPLWKFNTIPEPGEPGHETWENSAWKSGGGATWVTGSYDAELDLLYWGVGNPSPDYQGDVRPGDNLYSNSVVALQGSTGKLVWHFQFTPHDEHDWDSNQTPILTDLVLDGSLRKVILWANRNGFYYVLDRQTGEFLKAAAFGKQNWAKGIDARGRPILANDTRVSESGKLTFPGAAGSTNWQPPAFDPRARLVFVHVNDQGSVFTKAPAEQVARGRNSLFVGSGAANAGRPILSIRALEAESGRLRWEYREAPMEKGAGGTSGLLATAGGLVVGASGGYAFALDSSNGQQLWRTSLSGTTHASPISFKLDGKQVIAVWGGRALFLFGLPD
jgi:alcohol dehydrogenase (cytochrome c)